MTEINNGFNVGKNKIYIVLFSLLLVIAGSVSIYFTINNKTLNTQNIHISIRPTSATPVSLYNEDVFIGSYSVPEIDITLSEGVKYITVTSPTFKDKTVPLQDGVVVVDLEPKDSLSTEDVLVDAVSSSNSIDFNSDYKILNPKTYGNNEWIYGVLIANNQTTDGEIVVVKVSGDIKEIVFAGTDMSTESLTESGVPGGIAVQIFEDSKNDNL